jgi:hypothetical protein
MQQRDLIQRRAFLRCCAAGIAASGVPLYRSLAVAAEANDAHVLAPKPGHFQAKAKHLIVVFLSGGVSHVDTFDYKPRLKTDHGKVVPSIDLRGTGQLPLMGSPFKFSAQGKSGLMISELFPHLGSVADDLCLIRTMHTDIVEHFQAVLAMNTGSATVPMPSLGSWLSYGLGTFNKNLPSFVVLAEHMPYAGSQVWDCNFLPPVHQGVRIVPGDDPIPNLRTPARSVKLQELEQIMLKDVNEMHAQSRPGDLNVKARSATNELARGLMREAPEVFDVAKETDATLKLYGIKRGDNKSFAYQCLIARRLVERGVRAVELIDTGSHDNWDAHDDMTNHRPKALRVDQAVGALIKDLKQRGLFDQTLVAGCTEFGRTPWTDTATSKGRNHYAKAFSSFLTGAGVKGGTAYGETDDYGLKIVSNPVHVHDYHATLLHLMGLDHEKLTYRYGGRDFRLTDVAGKVLKEIMS